MPVERPCFNTNTNASTHAEADARKDAGEADGYGVEGSRVQIFPASHLLHQPGFRGATVSWYVADATSVDPVQEIREKNRGGDRGEQLSYHADQLLIPASTLKVITTAAALHQLGPNFTFSTTLSTDRWTGRYAVHDLYLWSNGDPWLVPEQLGQIANRLRMLGVREITGDLVIDSSYFGDDRMANGSEQDDSSSAYMAPAGAVSVAFNTVQIRVRPGGKKGEPGEITLSPQSSYLKVENRSHTVAAGKSHLAIDIVSVEGEDRLRVTGTIGRKAKSKEVWRRVNKPDLFAAAVIRSQFSKYGIRIKGRHRSGRTPQQRELLLTHDSPALGEIVNKINHFSNNYMAQQVALALGAAKYGAPATWDKAKRALLNFLSHQVGILPDALVLNNGSGLHDVNRVSAKQLVKVLQYMAGRFDLFPEFVSSLSVAGESGTLRSRPMASDLKGLVRGKTGTLSMASGLVGYLPIKGGGLSAFAVLVNGYRASAKVLLAAQDRFVVSLSQHLAQEFDICANTGGQ